MKRLQVQTRQDFFYMNKGYIEMDLLQDAKRTASEDYLADLVLSQVASALALI